MWIYLCQEMDPATRPPRLKPWLSTCHICDLQLSNQLFCHSTSPFLKKNKNITYRKNWYGDKIKYTSDLNDLIVWVQILTFRFSSLYFVTSKLEPQLLQWVLLLAELSSWRSLWTLSPGSRGLASLHCLAKSVLFNPLSWNRSLYLFRTEFCYILQMLQLCL